MRSFIPALAVLTTAFLSGCLGTQDDPTTLKDLRVLAMRFEPPEVMLSGCDPALLAGLSQLNSGGLASLDPQILAKLVTAASLPLDFRVLIGDPAGSGRALPYHLRACASRGDRECNTGGQYVQLSEGSTSAGELQLTVTPAPQLLDDGTPLLLAALNQDTYKGLGGIRLPLVLELSSPDGGEHLYAQKLMVFSCQLVPGQEANQSPQLPGILWEGVEWPESEVKSYAGRASVRLEPVDFTALQEAYVVPSLSLEPEALVESWMINWITTSGTMSSFATGGTDLGGQTGRHLNHWMPDQSATEPADVTMYFVVRDGRGGESWLIRHVHWTPE